MQALAVDCLIVTAVRANNAHPLADQGVNGPHPRARQFRERGRLVPVLKEACHTSHGCGQCIAQR